MNWDVRDAGDAQPVISLLAATMQKMTPESSGVDTGTLVSILSFVIAFVALAVNVSGLRRRPSIVADWGEVAASEYGYLDGLTVVVTGGRRPVQVDEIGLVQLPTKLLWTRRIPEWRHEDVPFRKALAVGTAGDGDLPLQLQDGESVRAFVPSEDAADVFRDKPGVAYTYVQASGWVYLHRPSRLAKKRLRRLRRIGGEPPS